MKDTILKFPSGRFTHSELATHNGKTNQQVWTAYQAAIKDGTIISAGERPNPSGKGKPSKIWEVNPNKNIQTTTFVPTVPNQASQSVPRIIRQVKPVKIMEATEATITPIIATKVASSFLPVSQSTIELIAKTDAGLPTVKPTVTPEPAPEVEIAVVPSLAVKALTCQVVTLDEVCPFCKTPLLCVRDGGRVRVWCAVNDYKICSCSENPYGVAKNVAEAVKVLTEKFFDKK